MNGRIVEIATDGTHLSIDRGFLKISHSGNEIGRIALDDIGALIVHGHGATFSANLACRLAERGAPMVICFANHTPAVLVWPINGHHAQGIRMQAQADATKPLKKRLWKEIIRAKIIAQGATLKISGEEAGAFEKLARDVRSGDPDNIEAQAARRYWPLLFGKDFKRDRVEPGINSLLNYGYMVLRAATARSIIAAGLHPSLSIFHVSKGEALRLSDDLMEPFRPYVDLMVKQLSNNGMHILDKDAKRTLASITTLDLEGVQGASPLKVCIDRLASSLALIYLGKRETLEIPGPPITEL